MGPPCGLCRRGAPRRWRTRRLAERDGGGLDARPSPSGSTWPAGGRTTTARAGTVDESQPQRSDEELLTGDKADQVQAAALAEYPGATVLRVETDSDGVYEAHLVTSDGQPINVAVDASFTVTGTQSGRWSRRPATEDLTPDGADGARPVDARPP